MKFEIFAGSLLSDLRREINQWLADNKPKVTHVAQCRDNRHINISIFYEED